MKKEKIQFHFKDMKKWQKKRLIFSLLLFFGVAVVFLSYACTTMITDKQNESAYWDKYMTPDEETQELIAMNSENAIPVTAGVYIDNLKELSIKGNYYRGEYQVWFRWNGEENLDMMKHFRVYKGTINKIEMIKELHEGDEHYQLARVDVSISKNYWTPRFPLESHQLRMYIESTYPIDQVVFVRSENSGYNPSLTLSGYEFTRVDTAVTANAYDNNHDDPTLLDNVVTSELMTQMEINRIDFGLYFKCFIALFGTSLWVFITLYINTYHKVDPLGMIPAALFGTVTNVMVGANLLPDALQIGLLEYVNFWGIFTILSVAFSVITINRIRNAYEDKDFAHYYGIVMFYSIVITIIIGHILLPLSAYLY